MAQPEAPKAPIAIQNIYFNGFQLTLSNADVHATLLLNNQPALGISMSYTTAKTLSGALTELIGSLEKVTRREIMTAQEVGKGLDTITGTEDKEDGNVH